VGPLWRVRAPLCGRTVPDCLLVRHGITVEPDEWKPEEQDRLLTEKGVLDWLPKGRQQRRTSRTARDGWSDDSYDGLNSTKQEEFELSPPGPLPLLQQ
jgi:hypothetical protein